jgi:GNAT superfamily N-acetyltransferase
LSEKRSWPLVVRRARASDGEAVLDFASATWDGWDYIPHAWPVWLESPDGVLLVGLPGRPADGSPPLDVSGDELPTDRPIAVARVAMTAPAEAWLEGIRVHPRVRGMDVATDLQVAELQWTASLGASVVRYATGQHNEGSHRLGARHGFELLCAFRTYWWNPGGADDEDDDEGVSGFGDEAREAATATRRSLLDRIREAGLIAASEDTGEWWERLETDANFRAGHGLYEHRAWALQELTRQRFTEHASRSEVVALAGDDGAGDWALAIFPAEALPSEDVSLHLGLLAGQGSAPLTLVSRMQQLTDSPIRFRLPESPHGSALDEAAFVVAGFARREWTLDILGRPLDRAHPPPPIDPASLVLQDLTP